MGQGRDANVGRRRRVILGASAAAYGIGNISWWMQPTIVGEVMNRYGVGETRAGLVVAIEMAAIALSSLVAARFVQRAPLRALATAGALLALAGTAASMTIPSYPLLLLCRAATGAGEGLPLAVASAALASFEDPDRAYGKMNVFNVALGTVSMLLMPIVARLFATDMLVFPVLLILLLVLAACLVGLPGRNRLAGTDAVGRDLPEAHRSISIATLSLLAGVFLVTLMSGVLWSFYYVLGPRAGLSADQVSVTLAIAIAASMLGSLLFTVIGVRFGRLLPMSAAILVMTVANLALSIFPDPLVFRAAVVANLIALYFLVPCFLGYAAAQDPSGRDGALVSGAYLSTGAIGPFVGGIVLEKFGPTSIGWIILAVNLVAFLILFAVDRRATRARTSPGAAGASIFRVT